MQAGAERKTLPSKAVETSQVGSAPGVGFHGVKMSQPVTVTKVTKVTNFEDFQDFFETHCSGGES